MMPIVSLFSGAGGLELGLEWAGLGPTVLQVELDPAARRILAHRWPQARRMADVRQVRATDIPPGSLVCGGFPCQDISGANPNAQGLDGARSGLWFEMERIVRQGRPGVVMVENVSRLVRRGLGVVVRGLSDLGYEVEGTRLRAEDVGAPHRRERLFLVAYAAGRVEQRPRGRVAVGCPPGAPEGPGHQRERDGRAVGGGGEAVAYADRRRRQEQRCSSVRHGAQWDDPVRLDGAGGERDESQAKPRLGRGTDGLADRLDSARWPEPRGAAQHPWEPPRIVRRARGDGSRQRLRMIGNAVVPHCAYVVGMRIRQRLETA